MSSSNSKLLADRLNIQIIFNQSTSWLSFIRLDGKHTIHNFVLIQVLEKAIRRLPAYLQDIAVLRLLENRSYEEISLKTGKRIQIIRTYMNKAKKRLKNDDALVLFIREEFYEETNR